MNAPQSFLRCAFIPVALIGGACASSGPPMDRATALLSPAPPPEGRTCRVESDPRTLPAADAVVDSARLVNAVRTEAGGQSGYGLLSLRFGEDGQILWARVIEANLLQEQSRALEQAVAQSLRPQEAGPSWGVRLRVETRAQPSLRVGRSEICPPIPYPGSVAIRQTVVTRSGALPTPTPPKTPRFAVLVDQNGRVFQYRLLESSGDLSVDRQFETWIGSHQFHPMLIDYQVAVAWGTWPPRVR